LNKEKPIDDFDGFFILKKFNVPGLKLVSFNVSGLTINADPNDLEYLLRLNDLNVKGLKRLHPKTCPASTSGACIGIIKSKTPGIESTFPVYFHTQ
jgi:hypothetical protein